MIEDKHLIRLLEELKDNALEIADDLDMLIRRRLDKDLSDKEFKEMTKPLWKYVGQLKDRIELVKRNNK